VPEDVALIAFKEFTRFIPTVPGHAQLVPSLRFIVIGVLLVLVDDEYHILRKVNCSVFKVTAVSQRACQRYTRPTTIQEMVTVKTTLCA